MACGCGGKGEIYWRATELGYVRRPDWDGIDDLGRPRVGWLTPSGLKCMVPKNGEFMLYTLCECLRRERGIPRRFGHVT